ncbi:unnamed protein product [Discosporangium mesarthrocarpum]
MLYQVATTPILNELHGGAFTNMSRSQFKDQFPKLWSDREADKLEFRFPGAGGESYQDVIQRVRPLIVELERQPRSLVVVCHLAVQRCLFAYYMGVPVKEVPFIDLPQHQLVELRPSPFSTDCRVITAQDMRQNF